MNTVLNRGKFHVACKNEDIDTIKTMIEDGFDPSFDNNAMLKLCFLGQYDKSILFLLGCNKLSKFDEDILKNALVSNNIEYVKLLLNNPNTTIPKDLEKLWTDVIKILRALYPHHEIDDLLDNEIKQLVTEHMYRLDGPIYNENIL